MKKGMIYTMVCILLVSIILTGCGSASSSETQGTIKIGYVSILSMAPAIVAEKKKLMEEEGLQAEYFAFGNGADLYKALASGKLDVAYAGVPVGVNWISKGAEIKAIAKVGDGSFGLLVKPDSNIAEAADLKGKKLGKVIKGSGNDLLARGFLLPEGGLTEADVELVELKMPNMEEAVKNGTLDAALAGEPFLTFAELRGLKVVKELPDPAIIVFAREAFLKEQPDTVKSFIQGHQASIDFLNQSPAEAAPLLADAFKVPEITADGQTYTPAQVIEKALARHTFGATFSEDDFAFYQQIADANYSLKMIEQPFDIQTMFDTSWVE